MVRTNVEMLYLKLILKDPPFKPKGKETLDGNWFFGYNVVLESNSSID